MRNAPLVTIVGETASGKSALAMALAERFNGELICADSWTVYKGFDIGTAKPSSEERVLVPHHLLDVAEPVEGFSAAVFQRLAKQAIPEIVSRGNLPILVGGTGLYVDSILYDYSFLPKSDPKGRAELNMKSLDELILRTQELGLNTEGIDLRNKRRVIRLIENEGERPTKRSIRNNTLVLGMKVERGALGQRVTTRVDSMFAAGLENEVKQLARIYGWEAEAMKGIGYREWRPYFAGTQTLEVTREKIIKSTMDLAKKQRTWFRRNNSIQWVSDRSNAVDLITTFLNKAY
jgi:tRNA dimethylallyltransferase